MSDVLTDRLTGIAVTPTPVSAFPEAVVYFVVGGELILADLTTPIHDGTPR
jgi:hypothetical protein